MGFRKNKYPYVQIWLSIRRQWQWGPRNADEITDEYHFGPFVLVGVTE